jgi:flagellar P-ring protein precursor FlgI
MALAGAALLFSTIISGPAGARSRIKDIADFQGIRDNMLIGYGLVVGLNGSGDSMRKSPFTKQSLEAMLERLGVNTRAASLNTANVAAVIVTADLPPFSRQGTRIDITVSALGDADDLSGGVLLVTPLMGADGEVYAVAQGSVIVSGFSAQGQGESIVKGIPTGGRISNGAIVEREIEFDLAGLKNVVISLRNPDLTTARRVAGAINGFLKTPAAQVLDPSAIQIIPPAEYQGRIVDLMTAVEQLTVVPDQIARVVIDEMTGVIVIGSGVRVDQVAIAQGNLTVRVTETPQVSQPGPLATAGQTAIVDRTDVSIDEDSDKRMQLLNTGVSLQNLVDGLNGLGVGPRDMIAILQSIKAAGALQAEIVVQ